MSSLAVVGARGECRDRRADPPMRRGALFELSSSHERGSYGYNEGVLRDDD
jgi:hypothetical protein